MKNYFFIAASSLLVMTACKEPLKDESVLRQRDSLVNVIDERETTVNEFINSFNEVERNLDEVSIKQHIITVNSDKWSDTKLNQTARINSEIKMINDLMESNSKKIKELSQKLNKTDKRNTQLKNVIETLNNQLNQKYAELIELNQKLSALNDQVTQLQISIDTLSNQSMAKTQTIDEKTAELHTAYYIVTDSKELKELNLIDKKGGLLGIGRTSKLNENLNTSMFTKIDYTKITNIFIDSKSMKIISTHPSDSYSLDKTGKLINKLVITDPEKFWSISKYLVIAK